MRLTNGIGPIALVAATLAACSSGSGSTTLDGGTSGSSGTSGTSGTSGGPAAAQAIVQATLAKGASSTCNSAGKTVAIGTFSPIAPAKNNDVAPSGGGVELTCKVAPAGAGFAVDIAFDVATGTLEQGFGMSGLRTATGAADGSTLVRFSLPGLSFKSTVCTIDPSAATGGAGGIAAGRYWTTFHCTGAQNGGSNEQCDIDGEIRVENCLQK